MNRAYAAVYLRAKDVDWPLDLGDDPAFGASAKHASRGGVLTWGICRRNLRNPIRTGDVVVFFAADRFADRRPKPVRYAFVGYATVAGKVSQAQIWEDRHLAVYRSYRNLLIRPDRSGGYVHDEPIEKEFWHPVDWLWRMTELSGTRKAQLKPLNDLHAWHRRKTTLNGRPLELARNYVLFRPEGSGTFIAQTPPVVAYARVNGRSEDWIDTDAARTLRQIILSDAKTARTGLRTSNMQTAHPHLRMASEAALVTQRLDGWCRQFRVAPRHS